MIPTANSIVASRGQDFRVTAAVFLLALLLYGYFFQGGGYNQNAQFDTVRSIVERGTFDIAPWLADRQSGMKYTGDVYTVGGRNFSNKGQGQAVFGAAGYWVIWNVERLAGIDFGTDAAHRANAWLTTVWASGVPGAGLAAAMYLQLRRMGLASARALGLSGAFACGTLVFPYATIMMSHVLIAACLFIGWMLYDDDRVTPLRAGIAGLLGGLALANWQPLAPVLIVPVVQLWRRGKAASAVAFMGGPFLAVCLMGAYQWHYFGSPLESGEKVGQSAYNREGLLFGRFRRPSVRRIYWLSVHPYRGLFYSCPLMIVALFGLLTRPGRDLVRRSVYPVVVVASFVLFYLTFDGWQGGWSVGPRYFVPAIPFLFLLAPAGFRRFPRIGVALIALSIFAMLVATGVNVQYPGGEFGKPPMEDPIGENLRRLTMGEVAKSPGGSNVGLLLALKGPWTLIPPACLIAGWFAWAERLRRAERNGSGATTNL